MTIRQEVLEYIIDYMSEARQLHRSPLDAARIAFPSVPERILGFALLEMKDREEEDWWQVVERTIDREVICRAIGGPEGRKA